MFKQYKHLFDMDVKVKYKDGDEIKGHWADWETDDDTVEDEEEFIVVDTEIGPIGIYESEVLEITKL